MNIESHIEHTLLKSTATINEIDQLCSEALKYGFAAVSVPPMFVKQAKLRLDGSRVRIATVMGFPFGYNAIEAKLAECVLSIVDGADELDMMINLVALKNKDWQYLAREVNTILPVIRKSQKIIKVIIEAGVLSNEEIITCCDIYGAASVDFIQLSSGFAGKDPCIDTLKLVRTHLSEAIKIKSGLPISNINPMEWIAAGSARLVCNYPIQFLNNTGPQNGGMIFENEVSNQL
ncbi:MAG: deoxyribose-phosphate aldolase [Ferruginibacter sp.]